MLDSSFAYVQVPDLPIQVERRKRAVGTLLAAPLQGRPVLVLDGPPGGRQMVVALSDEAAALGVSAGQTLRQAAHLCLEAVVLTADPEAYEAAFSAFLAVLGGCSPIVQPDRAAWGAWLDVGGLELLFGPDPVLAATLVRRAARTGLRARVGLGPNRLVARLAAALAASGGSIVVAPSQVRAFLEPLPIEVLPLGAESRERLALLGVHTLGRLLRLPRAALARQVGPDALALARAVEAEGEWLVPLRPPEWLAAEAEVDGALETREQLRHLLAPLAEALAEQLQERYLAASAVRLRLTGPTPPTPLPKGKGENISGTICPPFPPGAKRVSCGDPGPGARGVGHERLVHLPTSTASAAEILEAALSVATAVQPAGEDARLPDSVELALGELGPLGGRQAGLFEGQGARRAQAARAVEELAERFRGRLRAPAFARSVPGR